MAILDGYDIVRQRSRANTRTPETADRVKVIRYGGAVGVLILLALD
jgi:hypothetical protein